NITGSLRKMTIQLAIGNIKNVHKMARRKSHLFQQARVPRTDYNTAAVRILFKHANGPLYLVKLLFDPHRFTDVGSIPLIMNLLFIIIRKASPQHRVNRSNIPVFIGPGVPNMAILFVTQPADMVFSPEIPKEFQDDRP